MKVTLGLGGFHVQDRPTTPPCSGKKNLGKQSPRRGKKETVGGENVWVKAQRREGGHAKHQGALSFQNLEEPTEQKSSGTKSKRQQTHHPKKPLWEINRKKNFCKKELNGLKNTFSLRNGEEQANPKIPFCGTPPKKRQSRKHNQ